MDAQEEILRSLGRIEGELFEIRKLSERVRRLESWHTGLKGAWTGLVAGYVYLWRQTFGK